MRIKATYSPTKWDEKLYEQIPSSMKLTKASEDRGAFESRTAKSILRIIPGSGTDGLTAITGTCKHTATPQHCECELDYSLGSFEMVMI